MFVDDESEITYEGCHDVLDGVFCCSFWLVCLCVFILVTTAEHDGAVGDHQDEERVMRMMATVIAQAVRGGIRDYAADED